MSYQKVIAELTRSAGDALFQSARAVPEDKLNWTPDASTRSAIDIIRECAVTPAGLAALFEGRGTDPDFLEEFGRMMGQAETQTTLDALEEKYRTAIDGAIQEIENCPDESLDKLFPVPWGTGTLSGRNLVILCYWNMVYHLGQINYIQTMYGDKEMHSGM